MDIAIVEYGTLMFDYGLSLHYLLEFGNYAYIDKGIHRHRFPALGDGKEEVIPRIVTVRQPGISDRVVERELFSILPARYRFGPLQLLLTLAMAIPDVLVGTPIVPLASAERLPAHSHVPFAFQPENGRQVRWGYRGDAWPAGTRYLLY